MAEECHAEETKHLGDSSFRFAALRMTQWRRNVMLRKRSIWEILPSALLHSE
ncbi:hypothetical protein [Lyngbya aestuarii]|uniref:hypothetical protein n=1 Tax=Lyngbya aestuarii TaxID=118322 RepID=UPI00403DC5FC